MLFKTILLVADPEPRMVTSPVVFNVEVVSIEPDVLMLVAPVITEAPSIVPVVI